MAALAGAAGAGARGPRGRGWGEARAAGRSLGPHPRGRWPGASSSSFRSGQREEFKDGHPLPNLLSDGRPRDEKLAMCRPRRPAVGRGIRSSAVGRASWLHSRPTRADAVWLAAGALAALLRLHRGRWRRPVFFSHLLPLGGECDWKDSNPSFSFCAVAPPPPDRA